MFTIRYFLITIVIIAAINGKKQMFGINTAPDIIGGNYTFISKFPYAVAIFLNKTVDGKNESIYKCGGSVFKPNVIITAGHCIIEKNIYENGTVSKYPKRKRESELFIIAGHENYNNKTAIRRNVNKSVAHSCFGRMPVQNDIALLFLFKELPIGIIKPINIIKSWPNKVKKADTYGWGRTSVNETEDRSHEKPILKYTTVKVYTTRKCCIIFKKYHMNLFNESLNKHPGILCAGNRHSGEKTNIIYRGDSGSGVVLPGDTLIGLTSFHLSGEDYPKVEGLALFTNVTYYYDWIMDQTK